MAVAIPSDTVAASAIGREYASARLERHHKLLLPTLLRCLEGVPKGAQVLDLGCGTGFLSGELIARGYRVTGVDVSPSGIEIARRGYPGGSFHLASVTDPELPSIVGSGFAAIISVEVIEHLYSPAAFLSNCRALLDYDGLLIITTPYHGYVKNLATAVAGRFDHHFQPGSEGGHIKFWSKGSLTKSLKRHDFRLVDFHGCGRFPFLWKSMAVKAAKVPDRI